MTTLSSNLPSRVNAAHNRQQTGFFGLSGQSEPEGTEDPNTGIEDGNEGIQDGHGSLEAATLDRVDRTPLAENDDLSRRRILHRVRKSRLVKFIYRMFERITPPQPTTEELAIIREDKERKSLELLLNQEADDAASAMINKMTNTGHCRRRMRDGSEHITEEVQFDHIKITPNAFYFHVGSYAGQSVMDLYNDQVCTDLSESVGHRVRSQFTPDVGLFFILERASTMGIPEFVPFADMIERFAQDAPPLSFPVGVSANGRHIRRDLAEAPHIIIAGGSGKGKSVSMNGILATFISRNRPADVRLVLFDLKGGVEFNFYVGLPHLLAMTDDKDWTCDGIIETPVDVVPALNWLMDECQRRLKMLKKSGHKNIREHNRGRHERNRIPYIVAAIDEYAVMKTLASSKSEEILAALANISRAAGIHFILATQTPKAEVLNTKISVNFSWRLAFAMPPSASQVVLGSWDAVGLATPGRAIFQAPNEQLQVQAPRITNSTIRAIVQSAKSGQSTAAEMTSVDAEEILLWAKNNLNGKLTFDNLFRQFGAKITKAALNDLLISMDNQTFDVNGTLYLVEPGQGRRSRAMQTVVENQP
jgi:DNA segregation ATPase FtsK/SpoIIIE-like protein